MTESSQSSDEGNPLSGRGSNMGTDSFRVCSILVNRGGLHSHRGTGRVRSDRTRSPDVHIRLSCKSIDAKSAGHRKPKGSRSRTLDRPRSFDDVPYGGLRPFFCDNLPRPAGRPTLGIRSGEPSVVGTASGEMAARISPLSMDRSSGNSVNRTAHGKLDITC